MHSPRTLQRPAQTPTVPDDVTSTGGKLVYVYLSSVVEATVGRIADALGLKHIDLLPVLASLQQSGYVERDGDTCRLVA